MPSIAEYLAIPKVQLFFKIIRENGGILRSTVKLFVQDALKTGQLVGEDKYGNKYYENNYYFFGRNRWIEYAPQYWLDYDASQIPAPWYGWMHYKTDLTPCEEYWRPKYPWMSDHSENFTGTPDQYVPYSTTRPKIEPWKPPQQKCDE